MTEGDWKALSVLGEAAGSVVARSAVGPADKAAVSVGGVRPAKGRLQNRKSVELGTLSQQEGGSSKGLCKCPNPYFEPEIQCDIFSNSNVVPSN